MARPIKVLVTTDAVVSELQRRAKAPTSAYRDRFRAEIILLRLSGLKVAEVAARLGNPCQPYHYGRTVLASLALPG